MKYSMLTLILLILVSCTKEEPSVEPFVELEETLIEESSDAYFLNFTIEGGLYSANQNTYNITSTQDLDHNFIFLDAYKSNHKYPYFSYDETSVDSVDMIGTLRFNLADSSDFEFSEYDIEFVLSEALSNLKSESDSTYRYLDHALLYEHLKTLNFGNKNLFGSKDKSTLFLSFPESNPSMEDPYHETMTSNGFYFPNENLEFTSIEYDSASGQIRLSGNFEVEIKVLSCGFYSTHLVTEASFNALIQ